MALQSIHTIILEANSHSGKAENQRKNIFALNKKSPFRSEMETEAVEQAAHWPTSTATHNPLKTSSSALKEPAAKSDVWITAHSLTCTYARPSAAETNMGLLHWAEQT